MDTWVLLCYSASRKSRKNEHSPIYRTLLKRHRKSEVWNSFLFAIRWNDNLTERVSAKCGIERRHRI